MKIKIVIVCLAVVCLGLAIALFTIKQQGDDQHHKDVDAINDFSNQLVGANSHLDELRQVNLQLTNDLAVTEQNLTLSQQQAAELSNTLASANATLERTKTNLAGAEDQIASLSTHISELEAQNKVLDQRANDLTNTIAQLSASIENTQNRLAIAETNRVFIEQELQKELVQKAELEHKFNDLGELRTQVRKVRYEMFVARRLQLMKNDNSTKKGAEMLIQHTPTATNAPATAVHPANYNLNVEVGSDGTIKVIPPLGSPTNTAAH